MCSSHAAQVQEIPWLQGTAGHIRMRLAHFDTTGIIAVGMTTVATVVTILSATESTVVLP